MGFAGCCGALIQYRFGYDTKETIEKTLEKIEAEKTHGIHVVILNDAENKNLGMFFIKRGWQPFCHDARNPNTGNLLYGYAFSGTIVKKDEPKPVKKSTRKKVF